MVALEKQELYDALKADVLRVSTRLGVLPHTVVSALYLCDFDVQRVLEDPVHTLAAVGGKVGSCADAPKVSEELEDIFVPFDDVSENFSDDKSVPAVDASDPLKAFIDSLNPTQAKAEVEEKKAYTPNPDVAEYLTNYICSAGFSAKTQRVDLDISSTPTATSRDAIHALRMNLLSGAARFNPLHETSRKMFDIKDLMQQKDADDLDLFNADSVPTFSEHAEFPDTKAELISRGFSARVWHIRLTQAPLRWTACRAASFLSKHMEDNCAMFSNLTYSFFITLVQHHTLICPNKAKQKQRQKLTKPSFLPTHIFNMISLGRYRRCVHLPEKRGRSDDVSPFHRKERRLLRGQVCRARREVPVLGSVPEGRVDALPPVQNARGDCREDRVQDDRKRVPQTACRRGEVCGKPPKPEPVRDGGAQRPRQERAAVGRRRVAVAAAELVCQRHHRGVPRVRGRSECVGPVCTGVRAQVLHRLLGGIRPVQLGRRFQGVLHACFVRLWRECVDAHQQIASADFTHSPHLQVFKAKCMATGCEHRVGLDVYKRFLPSQKYAKLLSFLISEMVSKNPYAALPVHLPSPVRPTLAVFFFRHYCCNCHHKQRQ